MQLLHLSVDSYMPGASVADLYHRQYQIYGQRVPLEAAELWNMPMVDLVDFWRLSYAASSMGSAGGICVVPRLGFTSVHPVQIKGFCMNI